MSLDQQNLEDQLDVLVDGHLNLRKIEQRLEKTVIDIEEFYNKRDPEEGIKNKVPYQYQPEHQGEWNKLWIPIDRALAIVDKLVMDKHKILYSLEIAKSQQQPQQTGGTSIIPALTQVIQTQKPKEPKQGIWPWSKPKEVPTITPFKMSIQEILEKKKIKELFYDVIIFHKFKVEYGQPMILPDDINMKLNWMDYSGLANLLSVERTEFIARVLAVLTIISEGHEVIRGEEKRHVVDVQTAAVSLREKHAQNPMYGLQQ